MVKITIPQYFKGVFYPNTIRVNSLYFVYSGISFEDNYNVAEDSDPGS